MKRTPTKNPTRLEFSDELSRRAEKVDDLLTRIHGDKKFRPGVDPLTELIFTILSQNTNDNNRDRAFAALKKAYPTWEDVAAADTRTIAQTIRPAGLAEIRARRIKEVLRKIKKDGRYSLDFIRGWKDQEIVEFLTSLPGVGRKTAACVMAFSLGRNVMPVDTHVFRVAGRIGILPKGISPDKAHDYFARFADKLSLYRFHLNLIAHGRVVCRSRNPLCRTCRLNHSCDYFMKSKLEENKSNCR